MGRLAWAALAAFGLACGCGTSDATGEPDASFGSDAGIGETADATANDGAGNRPDAGTGTDSAVGSDSASGSSSDAGLDGQRTRPCDPHCVDVLTWHNDNARSGQNLRETVLTPANVNPSHFGKLFVLSVDGKVDAQPLFVSALDVAGKGTHDVVFVATEHDSLYAFDAENNAGADATPLWQVSLLGAGETTSDVRSCNQVVPEIGITSTPVIDLSTLTLYVVAMSKKGTTYFQRLHAIDIASGAEKLGGPVLIQATYPSAGANSKDGSVAFDPGQYKERAGLVLLGGTIYVTWASHCDIQPYTGWVMAYDTATLGQATVLDITPNGSEAANWASGAAPAVDSAGNLYFLAGNGTFDTTLDNTGMPAQRDFGNAMVKISTGASLAVVDYFATWDTVAQSARDSDFGSGGAMVLPDEVGSTAHPHLVVGAGKDPNIYLVDRDNMGKWNGIDGGMNNAQIVQQVTGGVAGGVFGSPAYFDHAIYYGPVGGLLKRFAMDGGLIVPTPASTSATIFAYPGATPSVSADGEAATPSTTAIVWAAENASPAVLHAYAATDLTRELYSSLQADGGRDAFGAGNKFIVPTIAKGHVYVGTTNGVGVFGLLP